MSQNRKRKLIDPITTDERAAKIKKFEKTFDQALKRKLSKKHKMALEAKKLKVSKPGVTTSQARAGTTVSTAKARGGAMVNANQIGVSTGAQAAATQVTTGQTVGSTSAAHIVATTTMVGQALVTTVGPSGQTPVLTSVTTGHLVTSTVVPSTHTLTPSTPGQTQVTTSVVTSQVVNSAGVPPVQILTTSTVPGQSPITTGTPSGQKVITAGGTTGQLACSTILRPQVSSSSTIATAQVPSSQENVSTTMAAGQPSLTNTVDTVKTITSPVTQTKPQTTPATLLTQQQTTPSTLVIPLVTTTTPSCGVSQETVATSMVSDLSGLSTVTTMQATSTTAQTSSKTTPPITPGGSTATLISSTLAMSSAPNTLVATTNVSAAAKNVPATISSDMTMSDPSTSATTTSNLSETTSDHVPTPGDALPSITNMSVSNLSTTSSNPPATTCNVSSEATTVSPIPSTTDTTLSSTRTNVTLLNSNVLPTYCTLPPVSSTLPAMIFDEPAETPSPSVTDVPSSTIMTPVTTSQDSTINTVPSCVADIRVSSDGPASNNCTGLSEEDTTNKELSTAKPSGDVGKNHTVNDVNSTVMNDTCSGQTLCATPSSDNKAKPLDSDGNTSQSNNDIQSGPLVQPGSVPGVSALSVNRCGESTDCEPDRGTEEVMDVDTVDSLPPTDKSSANVGTAKEGCVQAKLERKLKSDIQVVVKDGPKEQDLSSSSDKKDETLNCSENDTNNASESDGKTTVKNSATVEKMDVDDPKNQLNGVSQVGLTTSGQSGNSDTKSTPNDDSLVSVATLSQGQDMGKDITSEINEDKPPTASDTNEPISVVSNVTIAKTQEQNTLTNNTSSQVSQTTSSQSSATQDPATASQVSATTSQVSAPVSQISASQISATHVLATVSQMAAKGSQVSASQVAATPLQVSASPSAATIPSSVTTVRIETTGGLGLNSLTPESILKFIADELMKESDAGKALLMGVAASISTSEGKVIIKPEPATTSTAGAKAEPVKPVSMMATPGGQTSTPIRLILQTVPGHPVVPGGLPTSRIQVLKAAPQVVHTGVSQGKPLTPIAPAQRIVISNLPSGTVLGSQGQLLTKQGQVLGAQNIAGTKVIRMTIPRSKATPVVSSAKVVTTSKPSIPTISTTPKTSVTTKVSTQTTALSKPITENFPMRHAVIKDPKVLINMNLKKWKRRCSRKSIFVLDKNMVRGLARRGGLKEVQGFHYSTKWNSLNYPPDFPRPSLMTAWKYRTQSVRTLAAAAIQTRILNASMKWDEMNIRPPRGSSNTLKTSSGKII